MRFLVATMAVLTGVRLAHGQPADEPEPEPQPEQPIEAAEPEVIEITARLAPGSAHSIDGELLERHEYDDVHRVLSAVPGVYVREEDGFGLRPNIGMRGVSSERSAKVALMEDGVLIAPAPYSAPAAYYFPLVTRMSRVDVFKGPAAIRWGPNTVGGAVNLLTAPMAPERQSHLDTALGSTVYEKIHARHTERGRRLGATAEVVRLHSDGFKRLDGGGDTGFTKHDAQLHLRLNRDTGSRDYHQVDLRLGFADEVSDETYLGLADADFAADPLRRYRASALDRMDWRHLRARLSHRYEFSHSLDVTTDAYRHDLDRVWRKLNGFAGDRSLSTILANPTAGNNAIFYAVLTGQADSASPDETLLIGRNDRRFVSQGVQVVVRTRGRWARADHELETGLRLHQDSADRLHTEEPHLMQGGELQASGSEAVTLDALAQTLAAAAFVQDRAHVGPLAVTAGTRVELVSSEYDDRRDPMNDRTDTYAVLIPGAGATWDLTSDLVLLAGVHRGFVPVAPNAAGEASPESSINYEAGARWNREDHPRVPGRAELVGFFTDYANLKGTCTFSTGCPDDQVDDEFDGGRVRTFGVEAQASVALPIRGELSAPLQATYTFSRSTFQTSFDSENPLWGEVMAGDEVPYLPRHQAGAGAGLQNRRWGIHLSARYRGWMRDVAGRGEPAAVERVDAALILDAAAHWDFGDWGRLYGTVNNLLDARVIESRRPFGARPGAPRLAVIGYKATF